MRAFRRPKLVAGEAAYHRPKGRRRSKNGRTRGPVYSVKVYRREKS